jgi:threonine dehydrogenase-like Zn-dependent dehydrogenase
MRAIQMVKPRTVEQVEVPPPDIADGEALVRVQLSALCGSNMGPYLGEGMWAETDYPKAPGWDGHECIGVIMESRAHGWEEGTMVLAHPEDYGGFAEVIRSRPDGLARLPDDHPDPASLMPAQPLATVLRAMAKTGPVIDETCAVVGQGPIGLIFTHLLGRMGARRVIAIDLLPHRLEAAQQFGATDVVDASQAPADEAVRELTGGAMADFTVEAVGTPEALSAAARLPRRYGRLMVFGVPRQAEQSFPWEHVFRQEVQIVTSVGAECKHYFQMAVDMCAEGRVDLAAMAAPRLPFERAAEAFELYATHAEGCLKLLLEL